jgi:D-alanyl-lipoteichoic acid acyltransferase DltB (MBOAT superfamily)
MPVRLADFVPAFGISPTCVSCGYCSDALAIFSEATLWLGERWEFLLYERHHAVALRGAHPAAPFVEFRTEELFEGG